LYFDVVPGAIFALGLDIQHALPIFEVLFFVVGVFDHQICHTVFFRDYGREAKKSDPALFAKPPSTGFLPNIVKTFFYATLGARKTRAKRG
jgi:hypothetical protein